MILMTGPFWPSKDIYWVEKQFLNYLILQQILRTPMNDKYKNKSFWILISIAAVLIMIFLAGQTLGVFNYDLAVSIGMQESENEIGKIGIAFAKGFGFADTVIYIPFLVNTHAISTAPGIKIKQHTFISD